MSIAFFLIQFTILAYAFVGGVFLAFSDFIMRSLAMTGGHGGIEAMQVINREVFRWVFVTLFIGLAVVSLIIAAPMVAKNASNAGSASVPRSRGGSGRI